jgi:hypothetical protein
LARGKAKGDGAAFCSVGVNVKTVSLLLQVPLFQNSNNEIVWRTVSGVAIMDIADLAIDADLWRLDFRHINSHSIGNLAKR